MGTIQLLLYFFLLSQVHLIFPSGFKKGIVLKNAK